MASVPRTTSGQRVFGIKQGDRSPSLYHSAVDAETWKSVNLQAATSVQFVFRRRNQAPAAAVSRAAVIVTAETGEMRYDWAAGDTDIAGEYYGEFVVSFPDSISRTFPQRGYLAFNVEKDLNT